MNYRPMIFRNLCVNRSWLPSSSGETWRCSRCNRGAAVAETRLPYPVSKPSRMDPFHFGCDCDHEPVFEGEVSDSEVSDPDKAPNEALAAERSRESGFRFDVRQYAAVDPIPLTKYPTEYHAAFRRLAEARGLEVAE